MKIMMAKSWAHNLTEWLRRDDGCFQMFYADRKVPHPDLGECWVGQFVEGICLVDVHFPIDAVRLCTAKEIKKYTKGIMVRGKWALPFKFRVEDFAKEL